MPNIKQTRKKKSILNPDLSRSSERTITIDTLNGYVNIPTIWGGKQLTSKQAIARARKDDFQGYHKYRTLKEAEKAARLRSESLGRLGKGMP